MVRLSAPRLLLVAVLAVLAAPGCGGSDGGTGGTRARPGRARSVVVFTVDTLRADQLGAYGNTAYPTPSCDRLAAGSVVYEHAYTQATLTHPALSSMLSGLHPWRHAVMGQSASLGRGVAPLPALVRRRGYATGSFVANLCKLQDVERTVFHDGWDERWCGMSPPEAEDDQYLWDQRVVEAAIDWMEEQDGPFLCWVHLMDPHAEHRPDPQLWDYEARPVEEKFEQYRSFNEYEENRAFPPQDVQDYLWDLYAAEVRGMDRELGRMLDYLDGRDDGDEIALIFTADHGEELYETWSRYDHGLSMSEGVLWIPMMLRAPGVPPGRVDHVVELLQVTPTVLDLLDVPAPLPPGRAEPPGPARARLRRLVHAEHLDLDPHERGPLLVPQHDRAVDPAAGRGALARGRAVVQGTPAPGRLRRRTPDRGALARPGGRGRREAAAAAVLGAPRLPRRAGNAPPAAGDRGRGVAPRAPSPRLYRRRLT